MYISELPFYLLRNSLWMSWNVFLALIPFLLANHLFHPKRKQSFLWGLGFVVFFLFLPNAPYIFTDLIHLYKAGLYFNSPTSQMIIAGQFLLLELIAYWLFVQSYRKFERFLLRNRYSLRYFVRFVSFVTLSVGVYLGRFLRFNSWDVVTSPIALLRSLELLLTRNAIFFIGSFTLILLFVYAVHEALSHQKT